MVSFGYKRENAEYNLSSGLAQNERCVLVKPYGESPPGMGVSVLAGREQLWKSVQRVTQFSVRVANMGRPSPCACPQ